MIDTVVLTIAKSDCIEVKEKGIPVWNLYKNQSFFKKFVKNQTALQKKDEVYRPRINGIVRGKEKFIQIEFSIPKLILGNNLDEVREQDFELVLDTLKDRLSDFGVIAQKSVLRKATVSVFHPSKNITLSDGYTASGVIKELSKINLTQRMDLNKDSFRNDGQSLQLYANSHSLVLYDKIQDLRKPKGRAIDKDVVQNQLFLFEKIKGKLINPEILRIEVRLSNKTKMKSVLKKAGFKENPNFEDIFKKQICQELVKKYWDELIINKNLFLFGMVSDSKQMLNMVIKENSKITGRRLVYLIGLYQLCRDDGGIRNLRSILEKVIGRRSWYRIESDIKEINSYQNIDNCHSWVKQITEQINEFKSLRVINL